MDNKPAKRRISWLSIILVIIVGLLLFWLIWTLTHPGPKSIGIGSFQAMILESLYGTNANDLGVTSSTAGFEHAISDKNIIDWSKVNYSYLDFQNNDWKGKFNLEDPYYFSKFNISDFQRQITFTYRDKSYIMGASQGLIDSLSKYIAGIDGVTVDWLPLELRGNMNKIFETVKDGKQLFVGSFTSSYVVQESTWYKLLVSFGPVLLIFILMYFLYRAQMRAGGGIFNPGKNQAQKIISDKKFSDIAGNEEVKEEVKELVDYLKQPQKYAAAGARIPKGILLGGPPGTGKTLIAKATAGEANVPFFFISGSNFVEMYVGVGAKRVRELFKEARKEAPAIIFIDEIDAVGRSRGAGIGGGNDEREQTLNQLLVEMDGMAENSGILIMAATNRTDVLDPALLRPGRFDRTITVNLPDIKEREEILKLHAKGKRIDSDITFKNLAKRTPGYSGAQLENVINEAALLSVREGTGVITKNQIDEAIDRVMSGPAKKTRTISPEELEMVAYHEAGHAVVGLKVPGGNKVQKITIIPRGNAGGYNLMLPEKEKYNKSKLELEAMIKSYMGGRAAEEIVYGKENISTGAADDIQRATSIARRMVTEWGMSSLGPVQYEEPEGSVFLGRDYTKSKISDALSQEIDNEVRKIIVNAQKEAIKVIKENKELLELIKTLLLERETIVAEEIEYIEKNMKLPPKEKVEEIKTKSKINVDEMLDTIEQKNETNDNQDNTKTTTRPFDEH